MPKKKSFEESISRLEDIVALLERGDAPLDQSLKLFEEGSGLIRECQSALDNAEQVVRRLQKGSDGVPVELPFDVQEDE